MADNTINKIYDVRALGSDKVLQDLDRINQAFIQIANSKRALNNQRGAVEDPAQLAQINKQLSDLRIKEAALKVQRQELMNQAKQQQILRAQEIQQQAASEKGTIANAQAQRQLALARAAEAKAAADQARAEYAQLQSRIAQDKELDRLIGLEEKRRRAQEREQQANNALAGSYNALKIEIRDLYTAVKAAPTGSALVMGSSTVGYDQAIIKLKELMAQEQAFRRQFTQDGTLVGEYTTGILQAFQRFGLGDLIKGQADKATTELRKLNSEFDQLVADLRQAQAVGNISFETIEARLIENRNAAAQVEQQLERINVALHNTGDIGQRITTSIRQGFTDLKNQAGQLVIGYFGVQAALMAIPQTVDRVKELSDQTTNLEIELDKTAGGASKLVGELAKLNTRTKLVALEDIANIAVKAGTSEQNLVGVTEAIDKIKVAFGKDFGNVEEGTESLVKIINIFEGAGNVTGDNLLRTGNAIRTLANESVASVPYINDFTKRMAGLKGTFDISLPSVLGLSSGFENFGQSAEVASTALVKIIPKLATDVEKFAGIAGVTREEFSKLINQNPAEAFLRVSQALVQTTGGVEAFSAAFADSELGTGRIASIVGVAGKNADTFRQQISRAGEAIADTSNIQSAFAAKNENLAGTLDKISKKLADAANNRGFQLTISAIATVITFLINNLGVIIGVLSSYAVILGIANAAQVKLWLTTQASSIALKAQYAWLVITETFTKAYTAALNLLTIAQQRAAAASTLLRISLSLLGIGAVIALIAVLVGAFNTARAAVNGTTDALRMHARQLQIDGEIRARALQQISETIAKLDIEKRTIESTVTSTDTKRAALQRLIDMYPAFSAALDGEKVKLEELRRVYAEVTNEIYKQAEAQAAAGLVAEEQKKVLELIQLRQKVEAQAANTPKGRGLGFLKLTDEEKDLLLEKATFGSRQSRVPGTLLSEQVSGEVQYQIKDISKITAYLKSVTARQQGEYEQYLTAASRKQAELDEIRKKQDEQRVKASAKQAEDERLTANQLSALIKGLDDQINNLKEGDPKIAELIRLQDSYQKRLDAILGVKNKAPAASRLSGQTRDQFKDIEAQQKALTTELEKRYAEGKVQERNYVIALQQINDEAARKKIAKLTGNNAAERQTRAELQLQIVQDAKKTNEALYRLDLEALQAQKDADEREAQQQLKNVQNDQNAKPLQKAQAQQVYYDRMLEIQRGFQLEADSLEKFYNQQSVKNSQARADAVQDAEDKSAAQRLENKRKLDEELSRTLDRSQGSLEAAENTDFEKQKAKIYDQEYIFAEARNRRLEQLELAHQRRMLDIQKAGLLSRQQTDKFLYEGGVITAEEYKIRKEKIDQDIAANAAKYGELGVKQQEQSFKNVQRSLNTFAQGIQEVYDKFLGPLFDKERAGIELQLQMIEDQVDQEKEKNLAYAQSQAERDAIEKDAAQKKKAAEKKANEEKKQIALKELAIQSAVAAIKAFATAPNYIVGAIEAALIAAEYLIQRKKIEQQTFARGGRIVTGPDVPWNGGPFKGPSHDGGGIPVNVAEFEGGELAVINKKSAASSQLMTVTGTPMQIASAINEAGGGVSFAGGASVRKYDNGGYIGSGVRPPVFQSYLVRAGIPGYSNSAGDLSQLQQLVADLANIVYADAQKAVVLDPNHVTTAQNDKHKSVTLATI